MEWRRGTAPLTILRPLDAAALAGIADDIRVEQKDIVSHACDPSVRRRDSLTFARLWLTERKSSYAFSSQF